MDTILRPIEIAVAWIMVKFHELLVLLGMSDGAGAAWVFSVVGLTLVIRILLIPLFFKQIRASRGLQVMQPELQALQKKYKGKTDPASRQAQQQEMMDLYKKHGTNPFSSCLPILLQMPIFFALFRVLNALPSIADEAKGFESGLGPLTSELAKQVEASTLLGAPLSATFLGSDMFQVKLVAALLVVAMSVTTFITTKQLTMKNMPASALDNPMMRQQKMMMYSMPVVFGVSGVGFPIGVLIYWTTSNLWAMGQQFYTIRRQPAPGSDAYKRKQEREAAKRARKGLPPLEEETGRTEEIQPAGQRVQPMRKDRAKRKGQGADAESPERDQEEDVAEASAPEPEAPEEVATEGTEEVRGKDGLTDAERSRKRYEARAAEREAARKKRAAQEKRRREIQAKGKYNKDQ